MARAVITSNPEQRPRLESLYDIDLRTGASIEVFYADRVLAQSFGARGAGWFHWSCLPGSLPVCPPVGPFATSYLAYRDALEDGNGIGLQRPSPFGRRANFTSCAEVTSCTTHGCIRHPKNFRSPR
jgi:hypothetical protein